MIKPATSGPPTLGQTRSKVFIPIGFMLLLTGGCLWMYMYEFYKDVCFPSTKDNSVGLSEPPPVCGHWANGSTGLWRSFWALVSASTVSHTKQIQAVFCGALWESVGLNLQCNLQCATSALCRWTLRASQADPSLLSHLTPRLEGPAVVRSPEKFSKLDAASHKIHQKNAKGPLVLTRRTWK